MLHCTELNSTCTSPNLHLTTESQCACATPPDLVSLNPNDIHLKLRRPHPRADLADVKKLELTSAVDLTQIDWAVLSMRDLL